MGSSTTHQGNQKQSCLFMHLVISRQTMVGLWNQQRYKTAPTHLPELRKKCRVLTGEEKHRQKRNESPAFSKGNSGKPLEKNTCKFGHQRTVLEPSPQGSTEWDHNPSHREKGEQWWSTQLLPWYHQSWRNPFLSRSTKSAHTEPLWLGRGRKPGKGQIRVSKYIKGTQFLLTSLSRKSTH